MVYKYYKLVRDKIVNNINSQKGKKATWRTMEEDEYLKELNKKLMEEAQEFIEENDPEELADLMEVLEAIIKARNIKLDEVRKIKEQKKEKKGAFQDRIFLETVEELEKEQEK